MGYTDPQTGDIIGFDVDVAKEVFKRLNVELELCPIEWTQKETELNNGAVDMLWNGYSSTPERAEKVNLSVPYMKNNQIILVKRTPAISRLQTWQVSRSASRRIPLRRMRWIATRRRSSRIR